MTVLKAAHLVSLLGAFAYLQPTVGKPIFDSILNPFKDLLSTLGTGAGFVEASLGSLKGTLGIQQSFDYVVVGGGTAGNAIGYRLAEAGFSVAIIEAGAFSEAAKPVLGSTPAGDLFGVGKNPLDTIPTTDWGYKTQPQAGLDGRVSHYAQGKCVGGSSVLNFMLHHRPTEGTLDAWADAVGDDDYRLENMLPHYKNSVTFSPANPGMRFENASSPYNPTAFAAAGQGGPVQVTYPNYVSPFATWLEKALLNLGLERTVDFANGKLLGYHYAQATIRSTDQTRSSSASYIHTAKASSGAVNKNLKVFTKTLARQVLFDGSKKASGVKVSLLGALPTYTLQAKREVIVSAGAFRSPQLLMVSGVGPKATLDSFGIPVVSQLEGVGQNMWDHIMFGPSYSVNLPTLDTVVRRPDVLLQALLDYSVASKGILTSNVVELLAWEKMPQKYRDTWSAASLEALAQFPADWPEIEHLAANGYVGDFAWPVLDPPFNGKWHGTDFGALVAPLSRGNVTIASRDTSVNPLINPNWLTHPADVELAVSLFRRLREVFDQPALRPVRRDLNEEAYPGFQYQSDEQILDMIKKSLTTVWHPACTNKMGKAGDKTAVVDSKARVFGVQGLRVVDASAFPILPPGHPQATVYALAEKIAADIIKG